MNSRIHIFVYGNVQGVFFRANTTSTAKKLGVTGWVRNRSDGSVEVIAEGEKQKLEQLLEYCHHGPEAASVEKVKSEWGEYKGEFSDFSAASSV